MTRISDTIYYGFFFFFFLVCALNRLFEDSFIFSPYVDYISYLRRVD